MNRKQADAGLTITVDILRNLFRNLAQFRSYSEFGDDGRQPIDSIHTPDGQEWSLWDVERLYVVSQERLSPRQAEAIRYFLVEGMFEKEAAVRMGVSETNPIGMYAAAGIERLMVMIENREIQGFQARGGDS